MVAVLKDVLYSGSWHLPDGRVFECKPEEITYFADRMRDMMADGLNIPLSWEHQSQARPMTQNEWEQDIAERTKKVCGYAIDSNDGGCLEAKFEVPVAQDAERLKAVRFVSPKIEWNFRDGRGKVWEGPSITHVAVTSRPVQHPQRSFQIALSGARRPSKRLRLSVAATQEPVELALDHWKSILLGENMPFDKPGDVLEDGPDVGSDNDKLKDVIAHLAEHHFCVLGDDTTPENFLDRLYVALKTNKATENGGLPEEGDMDVDADENSAIESATEEARPMLMSMKRQRDVLRRAVVKSFRQDAAKRAVALSSLLGDAKVNALVAEIERAPVSLSADCMPTCKTMVKVEAFEEAIAAMGGKKVPAKPAPRPEASKFRRPAALSLSQALEEQHPVHLSTREGSVREGEAKKAGQTLAEMVVGK